MFCSYISESLCNYIIGGEHAAGNASVDYERMPDGETVQAREDPVNEKGFFILGAVVVKRIA